MCQYLYLVHKLGIVLVLYSWQNTYADEMSFDVGTHTDEVWPRYSHRWGLTSVLTQMSFDLGTHTDELWRRYSHGWGLTSVLTQMRFYLGTHTDEVWPRYSHRWDEVTEQVFGGERVSTQTLFKHCDHLLAIAHSLVLKFTQRWNVRTGP